MRQFMRHPADIPIEVSAGEAEAFGPLHTSNLGVGGLAFHCDRSLRPGSVVGLRIALVRPEFFTQARVVWCRAGEGGYDLGVEFLDPEDAFRARMVEQVCHIEEYRQTALREQGRELSTEQAALEWIALHAAQFPSGGADGLH